MAFANFFNRAATAASQVLSGFDLPAFRGTLDGHVIGIAFDVEAIRSTEAAATLDLLVRLVSRLHPSVCLIALDHHAESARDSLMQLALSINPDIDLSRHSGEVTECVVVGRSRPRIEATMVFAGSNGWTATLSRSGPQGSGPSRNPFGAGAAACIAAANVFRMVFADRLPGGDPDMEVTLSLLDYGNGPHGREFDPDTVDLGEAHLVGLGAIGNGAVWALSRMPGLAGSLHLVDHEAVDLSNLQRYVIADQATVDVAKVTAAERLLADTRLTIFPHRKRWGDYAGERGDWSFERVAVGLDTAEDRIAVQASLPRWIVNAWTRDIDLGVSRHRFGSDKACLACLYLPDGQVKAEDQKVAEEIGLPDAVLEVRGLLATNGPVNTAFVTRVAERLGVPVAELMPFVGRPLRNFYQGAICGGVVFNLTGGARPVRATVPMAFQSALAGIMLAAELVKHAAGVPEASTTSTRVNLLRPLRGHHADPKAKAAPGRCICSDSDFIRAYEAKYTASPCPM
ncbi:E2 ligase fold family C protein [Methylobacterium sp. WL116]|uniref:E2 ligase fold family C protein n=1 Tax=Methylobacterium sp. WL116 TaxID=2603889 RepID=UPI0011C9F16F|nr:E2 ligase fold family C protein [Methylobacterium sp. WL116]TXM95589.1 hypothetical protein FV223_00555 [Methylobacterium sp. WL116]